MGGLTTHVLNTAEGVPASGVALELYAANAEQQLIKADTTNSDGRCDAPLLEGAACAPGVYELHFIVGDYFERRGFAGGEPRFLDRIVVRFGITDPEQHYHVPLLVSPFGYSTYRGS